MHKTSHIIFSFFFLEGTVVKAMMKMYTIVSIVQRAQKQLTTMHEYVIVGVYSYNFNAY